MPGLLPLTWQQPGTADIRDAGFALIVLDPPRQGLGKASDQLAELAAAGSSISPAIRRPWSATCPALRQRVSTASTQPGGHVPQTHHIEAVAFLKKMTSGRLRTNDIFL